MRANCLHSAAACNYVFCPILSLWRHDVLLVRSKSAFFQIDSDVYMEEVTVREIGVSFLNPLMSIALYLDAFELKFTEIIIS